MDFSSKTPGETPGEPPGEMPGGGHHLAELHRSHRLTGWLAAQCQALLPAPTVITMKSWISFIHLIKGQAHFFGNK